MADEPREVELKFRIDPVKGPQALSWLAQGRPQATQDLTAIYFDTAALDLRRAGFALRVRHEDGGWMQTVKSRAAAGGKIGRGEWSSATVGPAPDMAAARRTPAREVLGDHAALKALFTVKVTRQTAQIRTPDGVIEASLDSGAVACGERLAALDELELELKDGAPTALFALATRLTDAFPLELSVITKADRGCALAAGRIVEPRRFQSPEISDAMTTGETFQAMARAALEQSLWNAELLRETPMPEAMHQARVGLRRLRSTMATFKSVSVDGRRSAIRAGLKALSAELDPARNLDVFIEGAWGRDHHPQGSEDDAPRAALAAAYERARAALRGVAARRTLMDAMAWIEVGPWTLKGARRARRRDRPIREFSAAWLEKGRARIVRAGANLVELDPPTRHKLRIQAKGLRYTADVFDQLFAQKHPKRARRFLAALERLVEDLGDLNDIATARLIAPTFPHAPEVLARESARERSLLLAAQQDYELFKAAKRYWKT